MPLTKAKEEAILKAMQTYARQPIKLDLDVQGLLMIIGGLQLALRHPKYPPTSRRIIRQAIKGWRDALWTIDANLAHMVDYGFNTSYDAPRR
jgi:hypothetical protein